MDLMIPSSKIYLLQTPSRILKVSLFKELNILVVYEYMQLYASYQ